MVRIFLMWVWLLSVPVLAQPLSGHWDAFNRRKLEELLTRGSEFDPHRPPYVVFDWDNTSVFLDVEEATITYQLQNLRFSMNPWQLAQALGDGLPRGPLRDAWFPAQDCVEDIVSSYSWLYQNYRGLQGNQDLAEVQQSPHYLNFVTKMRYLYEALDSTYGARVSYPWLTYFFAGMTHGEVRTLTRDALLAELEASISEVCWTSSREIPGKIGVVSVRFRQGLRLLPEMLELHRAFRRAGYDVWICSASLRSVIEEMACNPEFGFGHQPTRILALELEVDGSGQFLPRIRRASEKTFGPGKTQAIRRHLVGHYGYGPVFVAGDSAGDQDMLSDFSSLELGLLINRLPSPSSKIGQLCKQAVSQYGTASARYLLQGRDENQGTFRPSQATIPLGQSMPKLVP